MLEEDLFQPICEYLKTGGFTVRSEVNDCDVAAVKDDVLIIIEMKSHLNLDVIIQASLRQRLTDIVYIAVPKPRKFVITKKWQNTCHLLRRLELGLMLVSVKNGACSIEIAFEPAQFKRELSQKRSRSTKIRLLKEFSGRSEDYNKGGSRGKKLVTTYREMAIHIACCLDMNGISSPKQLRKLGTDEKKTLRILADNHYRWFIHESPGKYSLSDIGKEEFKAYPRLVEYYKDKLNKAASIDKTATLE